MDARYQAMLDMPRPRTVQLSRRGRSSLLWLGLAVGAVEVCMLVSLYFDWDQLKSLAEVVRVHGLLFYATLLIPILPFWYKRSLLKQKSLLQNGEIAVAHIKEWIPPGTNGPKGNWEFFVKYTFPDKKGETVEGRCLDSTKLLRVGSNMLVYYNPDDLDDKVAQCEAYFELFLPGYKEDFVDAVG
ncbi:MAG TPA: hypothetical protein VJV96_12530 [Candidatus Angelobacter sp.]|jgi:hypothetical protein|nr:hypothetical protein [Candidatus Angelobacter sp.]